MLGMKPWNLMLRTISAKQFGVFGAVADLCNECPSGGKLATSEDLESMEIPTALPVADPHTGELQENLLQDYEHKFEQLFEDQKLSKLDSKEKWDLLEDCFGFAHKLF